MLGRDEKNKQNIIQCGIFVCFIENDQYTSTHSLFIITDSVGIRPNAINCICWCIYYDSYKSAAIYNSKLRRKLIFKYNYKHHKTADVE